MRAGSLRKPLTINFGKQSTYYMSQKFIIEKFFQDGFDGIVFVKYYAYFVDQN
jgi:hypothetical protein